MRALRDLHARPVVIRNVIAITPRAGLVYVIYSYSFDVGVFSRMKHMQRKVRAFNALVVLDYS